MRIVAISVLLGARQHSASYTRRSQSACGFTCRCTTPGRLGPRCAFAAPAWLSVRSCRPMFRQAEIQVTINRAFAFSGPLPLPAISHSEPLAALEFGKDLDGQVCTRVLSLSVVVTRVQTTAHVEDAPVRVCSLGRCSSAPVSSLRLRWRL